MRGSLHLLQKRVGERGKALAGKEGNPILGRHRWDLKPRSQDDHPRKASGSREVRRGGRQAGPESPRPAPPPLPPLGTRDRGQRQRRLGERPRSQPGPPAAHLRVSPPPLAPTVHPAGPGGGCTDTAPTGPRAARPGLPAPGTHRVPASHRLLGAAGLQGRKQRQKGCLPSPQEASP